jgi:hypothetical protein
LLERAGAAALGEIEKLVTGEHAAMPFAHDLRQIELGSRDGDSRPPAGC